MFYELRKELEKAKEGVEHYVLGGLLSHEDYKLFVGETRGLATALRLLEELYKNRGENDREKTQ